MGSKTQGVQNLNNNLG